MIEVNNLFDYCNDSIVCYNALLFVGEIIGNTLQLMSIDINNNYIHKYSNEWLYLINNYYPSSPFYNNFIERYKNIVNNKPNNIVINEDVISFITSFSTGTVHGYSGIYYILSEYLKNYEQYKNKKIIVYRNSQKGILDIIEHMCNRGAIDRNNIIYIEKNTLYHIHSITYIPNKYHIINNDLCNIVTQIIYQYIIPDRNNIEYYESLNLPKNLDTICIIKGSNSHNLTSDGIVHQDSINNFSNIWGITIIEPGNIHEVHLIHAINKSRIFITTWGTAFLKNFIYISDDCQKIIVLIIGDAFINQYHNNYNNKLNRYKNAEIIYKIVDVSLNFNPFE
jgi:hypothetical protein